MTRSQVEGGRGSTPRTSAPTSLEDVVVDPGELLADVGDGRLDGWQPEGRPERWVDADMDAGEPGAAQVPRDPVRLPMLQGELDASPSVERARGGAASVIAAGRVAGRVAGQRSSGRLAAATA